MKKLRLFIWIGVLLLIIGGGVFVLTRNAEETPKRLCIRFDDYGIWCSSDWISIEERLLDLHKTYRIPITWSVVPKSIYPHVYHPKTLKIYPNDDEAREKNFYPLEVGSKRVDILRQSIQDSISFIATHGYYHPKFYSNIMNSEFEGVDYDTQFWKIRQGKIELDSLLGIDVHVFVPPHNSYDELTLNALTETGYTIISSKEPSERSPEDEKEPIKHLNFTTDIFTVLKDKYNNEESRYACDFVDVLLLHHTSFTDEEGMIDETKLKDYELFLDLLNKKNVKVVTFDEVCENDKLYKQNNTLRRMLYRLSTKLSPRFASKMLSINISEVQLIFTLFFILFLIGFVVGAPFSFLCAPFMSNILYKYIFAICVVLLTIFTCRYLYMENTIKGVPMGLMLLCNRLAYVLAIIVGVCWGTLFFNFEKPSK